MEDHNRPYESSVTYEKVSNKEDPERCLSSNSQDKVATGDLNDTQDRTNPNVDGKDEPENICLPAVQGKVADEITTDKTLNQNDSVTNPSEVVLSTPTAPCSDDNTEMSFRAHFGTIRKTSYPTTSIRNCEEPEIIDRVTQSPISVWSGGSTSKEGDEDVEKPRLFMLGEQQPGCFQVTSSFVNDIERLSVREPEIWSNSSFLPDVKNTNSSTNTDALERPFSKANRKRDHDEAGGNETQQQKLRNLHSKYGLLRDDDEENLDDVRGEEYEEVEEDGQKSVNSFPESRMLKPTELDYSMDRNEYKYKFKEGSTIKKELPEFMHLRKSQENYTLEIATDVSCFQNIQENYSVHTNSGDSPLAIVVREENSSASSGVGMSSPESRSVALMQDHDMVDCDLVNSSSAEGGICNLTSPALAATSGHHSTISDDQEDFQTLESTQDEIFHSVDDSLPLLLNNESSGTIDEYQTPLQSPKTAGALEEFTENVFSSSFSDDSHKNRSHKGIAASKRLNIGPAINPDKVLVITDETVRQALREEVERKLTRLERRIRSLSDSAISSDYCTDPDSCSVSPRCSRLRDLSVASANLSAMAKSNEHGIIAQLSEKTNEARMVETIPYTLPSTAHRESLLKRPESTEYPYEAPVPDSRQGRFPERLVNAILTIKEYPVFLSPSLRRLQRRKIRGRLTRSMDDIRDIENKFESYNVVNALEAKGQRLYDYITPKTMLRNSDPLHSGSLQSAFHLSAPESSLHQMRQNVDTEACLDKQFRKIMASQRKTFQVSFDNTADDSTNEVTGSIVGRDGAMVFEQGQFNPSESEIRRLQAARVQVESIVDDKHAHRDSQDFYSTELYPSQKRSEIFKIPSESDIPSQLEQIRDETRFQIKLAVLRSASVDYLACPDVEQTTNEEASHETCQYHITSPKKTKEAGTTDMRAPSSPRKFRPKSYASSLNSSIGFMSGHVSRSADSILTSNDSFDSPRYRGHSETFPLLLDRSASLDDIYYQQLMKVQNKRQALNRSRSTGMVEAGDGADTQNEPDDQIFPPTLQDTSGDDEIHEVDNFADVDTELPLSSQQDAAVISTVGFNYRKASHPRDFRGFNEELRQQLEYMAQHFAEREETLPLTKSVAAYDLSPRSESSEYSSDSYFKAAEVESGTPYFKEYSLEEKPIQFETGSQTEHASHPNSFDSQHGPENINLLRRTNEPIPLSQASENWQEVSKVVMEATNLLNQIRAQPADIARLELDSSGESFNTETITGRSLSSKGDSPRKKLRIRTVDSVTDNLIARESENSSEVDAQLRKDSSEHEERQRRNSQLADNITAVMQDLTSQEVKLPVELQQRILEEFLRTRHERELEEHHQQQQLEQTGVSHIRQTRHDLRRSRSCGSYSAKEETMQDTPVKESSTLSPVDENVCRYTIQYDTQTGDRDTVTESNTEVISCIDEEIMTDPTDMYESSTQTTPPKSTRQSDRIIIKVRDTMTQTGFSLNNSVSEEVQTDLDISFNSEKSEDSEINFRESSIANDPTSKDTRSSQTDKLVINMDSHEVQTKDVVKAKQKDSEKSINICEPPIEEPMDVNISQLNANQSKVSRSKTQFNDTFKQQQSIRNEEIQTDLSLSMFQRPTIHVALSTDDLPHQDDLVLYSTKTLLLSGSSQTDVGGDANEGFVVSDEVSPLQKTFETNLSFSESEVQRVKAKEPDHTISTRTYYEVTREMTPNEVERMELSQDTSAEESQLHLPHESDNLSLSPIKDNIMEERSGAQYTGKSEISDSFEDGVRAEDWKACSMPVSSFEHISNCRDMQRPAVIEATTSTGDCVETLSNSNTTVYEKSISASRKQDLRQLNFITSLKQDDGMSSSIENIRNTPVSNIFSENEESSQTDNISSSMDVIKQNKDIMKDEQEKGKNENVTKTCLTSFHTDVAVLEPSDDKSLKKKKRKRRKKKKTSGAKNYPEDETDSQVSESTVTNESPHTGGGQPEVALSGMNKITEPSSCIISNNSSDLFVETSITTPAQETFTIDGISTSPLTHPQSVKESQHPEKSRSQTEKFTDTYPAKKAVELTSTDFNMKWENQTMDTKDHISGGATQMQYGVVSETSEAVSYETDTKEFEGTRSVTSPSPLKFSNEEQYEIPEKTESDSVKESKSNRANLHQQSQPQEMHYRASNESESSEEEKTFFEVIYFPITKNKYGEKVIKLDNQDESENYNDAKNKTMCVDSKRDTTILPQEHKTSEHGINRADNEANSLQITEIKYENQRNESICDNDNAGVSKKVPVSSGEEATRLFSPDKHRSCSEKEVVVKDITSIPHKERLMVSNIPEMDAVRTPMSVKVGNGSNSNDELTMVDGRPDITASTVSKDSSECKPSGEKLAVIISSERKSESDEEVVVTDVIPLGSKHLTRPVCKEQQPISSTSSVDQCDYEEEEIYSKQEEVTSRVDKRSDSEELVLTDNVPIPVNSKAAPTPMSKEQKLLSEPEEKTSSVDKKSDSEEELVLTDVIPIPVKSKAAPTPVSEEQQLVSEPDEKTSNVNKKSDSEDEVVLTDVTLIPVNSKTALTPVSKEQKLLSEPEEKTSSVDKKSDSEEELVLTDVIPIPVKSKAAPTPVSEEQQLVSEPDEKKSNVNKKSDSEDEVVLTDATLIPVNTKATPTPVSEEQQLLSEPEEKTSSVDKKIVSEEELLLTDVIPIPVNSKATPRTVSKEQQLLSEPDEKTSNVDKKSDSEDEVVLTDATLIPVNSKATPTPVSEEQQLVSEPEEKTSSVDKKRDSEEELVLTDVIPIPVNSKATPRTVSKEQQLLSEPDEKTSNVDKKSDSEDEVVQTDVTVIPVNSKATPTPVSKEQQRLSEPDEKTSSVYEKTDSEEELVLTDVIPIPVNSKVAPTPVSKEQKLLSEPEEKTSSVDKKSDSEEELVLTDVTLIPVNSKATPTPVSEEQQLVLEPDEKTSNVDKKSDSEDELVLTDVTLIPVNSKATPTPVSKEQQRLSEPDEKTSSVYEKTDSEEELVLTDVIPIPVNSKVAPTPVSKEQKLLSEPEEKTSRVDRKSDSEEELVLTDVIPIPVNSKAAPTPVSKEQQRLSEPDEKTSSVYEKTDSEEELVLTDVIPIPVNSKTAPTPVSKEQKLLSEPEEKTSSVDKKSDSEEELVLTDVTLIPVNSKATPTPVSEEQQLVLEPDEKTSSVDKKSDSEDELVLTDVTLIPVNSKATPTPVSKEQQLLSEPDETTSSVDKKKESEEEIVHSKREAETSDVGKKDHSEEGAVMTDVVLRPSSSQPLPTPVSKEQQLLSEPHEKTSNVDEKSDSEEELVLTGVILVPVNSKAAATHVSEEQQLLSEPHEKTSSVDEKSDSEEELVLTDVIPIPVNSKAAPIPVSEEQNFVSEPNKKTSSVDRQIDSEEELVQTDVIPRLTSSKPLATPVSKEQQLLSELEETTSSVDKKSDSKKELVLTDVISIPISSKHLSKPVSEQRELNSASEEKLTSSVDRKGTSEKELVGSKFGDATSSVDRQSDSEEEVVVTEMILIPIDSSPLPKPFSKEQKYDFESGEKLSSNADRKGGSEEEVLVIGTVSIPNFSPSVSSATLSAEGTLKYNSEEDKDTTLTGPKRKSDSEEEEMMADVIPIPDDSQFNNMHISSIKPEPGAYCGEDIALSVGSRRKSKSEEDIEVTYVMPESNVESFAKLPVISTEGNTCINGDGIAKHIKVKKESDKEALLTDVEKNNQFKSDVVLTDSVSHSLGRSPNNTKIKIETDSSSKDEAIFTDVISHTSIEVEKNCFSSLQKERDIRQIKTATENLNAGRDETSPQNVADSNLGSGLTQTGNSYYEDEFIAPAMPMENTPRERKTENGVESLASVTQEINKGRDLTATLKLTSPSRDNESKLENDDSSHEILKIKSFSLSITKTANESNSDQPVSDEELISKSINSREGVEVKALTDDISIPFVKNEKEHMDSDFTDEPPILEESINEANVVPTEEIFSISSAVKDAEDDFTRRKSFEGPSKSNFTNNEWDPAEETSKAKPVRKSIVDAGENSIEERGRDCEDEKPMTQTISATVTNRGEDLQEKITVTHTITIPGSEKTNAHDTDPSVKEEASEIPERDAVPLSTIRTVPESVPALKTSTQLICDTAQKEAKDSQRIADSEVTSTEMTVVPHNKKERPRSSERDVQKEVLNDPAKEMWHTSPTKAHSFPLSAQLVSHQEPQLQRNSALVFSELEPRERRQVQTSQNQEMPVRQGEAERKSTESLRDENKDKLLTFTEPMMIQIETKKAVSPDVQRELSKYDTYIPTTQPISSDEITETSITQNRGIQCLQELDVIQSSPLETVIMTEDYNSPNTTERVKTGFREDTEPSTDEPDVLVKSNADVDIKTAVARTLPDGEMASPQISALSEQNLSESQESQKRFLVAKHHSNHQELLRSTLMPSNSNLSTRLRQISESETDCAFVDPSNDSGFLSDDTLLTFRSNEFELGDNPARLGVDTTQSERAEAGPSPSEVPVPRQDEESSSRENVVSPRLETQTYSEYVGLHNQGDQTRDLYFESHPQDDHIHTQDVELFKPEGHTLKENVGSLDLGSNLHREKDDTHNPECQPNHPDVEKVPRQRLIKLSNVQPPEPEKKHHSDVAPHTTEDRQSTQLYHFEPFEKLSSRDHSNGKRNHQQGSCREKTSSDPSQQHNSSQDGGYQSVHERKQHGASPPPPPPPPHWQPKTPQAALDYDNEEEEESKSSEPEQSQHVDGLKQEHNMEQKTNRTERLKGINSDFMEQNVVEKSTSVPLQNESQAPLNKDRSAGLNLFTYSKVQQNESPDNGDISNGKATPRSSSSSDEEMVVVDEVFTVPLQPELVRVDEAGKTNDSTTLVSRQVQRYHGRSKRRHKDSDSHSESSDIPSVSEVSSVDTIDGASNVNVIEEQENQEILSSQAPIDENLLKPVLSAAPRKKIRRKSKQIVEYELDDDEDEAGVKLEYVVFDNNRNDYANPGEKISPIVAKPNLFPRVDQDDNETLDDKAPHSERSVQNSAEDQTDMLMNESHLPRIVASLSQSHQQAEPLQSEDVSDLLIGSAHDQDLLAISENFAKEMRSGDRTIRLEAEKATKEAYASASGDAERLDNLNTLCIATSFEPPNISTSKSTSKNLLKEKKNDDNASKQGNEFKFETWESKSIYNFEDEEMRDKTNQRRKKRHASDCEPLDPPQESIDPNATNHGPYPHGLGFFWQNPVETTRGSGRRSSFRRANSALAASVHDDPFALSNHDSDTLVFPLPGSQTDQNSREEDSPHIPSIDDKQTHITEDMEILALAEAMLVDRSRTSEEPDQEICQELIKKWDGEDAYTRSQADCSCMNKAQETPSDSRDLEILVLADEMLRSGDKENYHDSELSTDLVKEWDSDYMGNVVTEEESLQTANEAVEDIPEDSDDKSMRQGHLEVQEFIEKVARTSNRINFPTFQDMGIQTISIEFEQASDAERKVHNYPGELNYRREETIKGTPASQMSTAKPSPSVLEGPTITLASDTDLESLVKSPSKGIQVSLSDVNMKEGEVSYRREENALQHKPSLQPPRTLERGIELTTEPSSHASSTPDVRPRSLSDPVSPRSDVSSSLWRSEFIGGREVVISVPPASTVHPVSLHHSLSTPVLSTNDELTGSGRRRRRRSGRLSNQTRDKDLIQDYVEETARERSPLLRRSLVSKNNADMTISNQQILNEIEKLKHEHSKMMDLLERSKERKARKERGKLSIADTDSSGGDSPVTVIAGPGSVSGSNTVSPTSTPSSQTSSPPNIVGTLSAFRATDEISARIRGFGVGNDPQSCLRRNLDLQDSPRSSEEIKELPETNLVTHNNQAPEKEDFREKYPSHVSEELDDSLNEHYDQDQSSFDGNFEDLLLRVPDFVGVGPCTTKFDDANIVMQKNVPKQDASTSPIGEFVDDGRRSTSPTEQYDKRTADLIKAATETLSVRIRQDSSGDQWPPLNMDESLSPGSRVSVVSPLTLQAILDDDDEMTDADSAFSTSTATTSAERHRRRHIQMVSTGTEVSVDNLDDSTQTEDTDLTYDDSTLHTSMLSGAHGGASSDSSGHDMSMVHRELDRLHRERVEIIELLSLHYLPSSLTIELLEAKLNYCIGQTDTLLATLEDAWAMEDGNEKHPKHSRSIIKVSQHYLNEYRSEFIRSKRNIESCLETHQRRQTGARGRRRTRGRDVRAMRRRAEIEAFKLERLKEQCKYERELNKSRRRTLSQSSVSLDDTSSVTSSSFLHTDSSRRRRMTPSERKDHLVSLRKKIVMSTAGEMLDMRNRSMSPRSPSDSYWALQPSYSAPHSPARSESPGVLSSGLDRIGRVRRGSNSSWHAFDHRLGASPARSLPDTARRGPFSVEHTRPHSIEPVLGGHATEDVSVPGVRGSLSGSLSLDLRTNVMASLSGPDMSADRLIEESNEVRRQNQKQIEKAKEMLRHLDEKRSQIRVGR